ARTRPGTPPRSTSTAPAAATAFRTWPIGSPGHHFTSAMVAGPNPASPRAPPGPAGRQPGVDHRPPVLAAGPGPPGTAADDAALGGQQQQDAADHALAALVGLARRDHDLLGQAGMVAGDP